MFKIVLLCYIFTFITFLIWFYLSTKFKTKTKIKNKVKARPVLKAKPPTISIKRNSDDVLTTLLDGVKTGNEQSVIDIIKVYLYGVHPYIKPDVYTAAKIINFVNNDHSFSRNAKILATELQSQIKYETSSLLSTLPSNIIEIILNNIPSVGFTKSALVIEVPEVETLTAPNTPMRFIDPDFFDLDTVDIATQQRIMAEIERENTNNNFAHSQNVHSNSLQNVAKQIVDTYDKGTGTIKSVSNDGIVGEIKNMLIGNERDDAVNVYNSLNNTTPHTRYGKTEKEIFDIIYNTVKDNNDWKQILYKSLASCVEDDSIVCSTGKVVRIIGSLDGLGINEDHGLPKMKPEYIIDNELSQLAIKTKNNVLANLSKEEVESYEIGENNAAEQEMRDQFKEAMNEEYTGILSGLMLEAKYEHYASGF